jgi:hypothetical protein
MADYYRDVIRFLRENGYELNAKGAATTKFGGIHARVSASPSTAN